MNSNGNDHATGDELIGGVIATQLAHFRNADPPCRGVQLTDGVLLRYTQAKGLYFYLRTVVENGAIRTQVYASDSPYDRQKAAIGLVSTPMFDQCADHTHLDKVEALVRDWVEFVEQETDTVHDFQSFAFKDRN